LVNDGDLFADSHILHRYKNYFFHLLHVHRVSDVRQIEIHIAEPLISEPRHFEVDIATENSTSKNNKW
jgi:hypothetical protein